MVMAAVMIMVSFSRPEPETVLLVARSIDQKDCSRSRRKRKRDSRGGASGRRQWRHRLKPDCSGGTVCLFYIGLQ